MKKSPFFKRITNKYRFGSAGYAGSRPVFLLWVQTFFIFLLTATLVLVSLVDTGGRLFFYLLLVGSLLAGLVAGYISNIKGKYIISAWVTMICMVAGPWFSILLDPSISSGDFVPLIYITLSIQLCSIFLSSRITAAIAAVQITGLTLMIILNPALLSINWPSLLFFVLFTATLGIISSVVMRKHIDQIEKQRKQLEEKGEALLELSVRDALTGLFNRRYMEETLKKEISRAKRKNRPLSLIMADINEFKHINDTYGHMMGDHVLRNTAVVLGSKVRSSDIACRYGGDEFVLILTECTAHEAVKRAEELNRTISSMEFNYDGKTLKDISLTYGVASYPQDAANGEELIKAADRAFYQRKRKNGAGR